MCKVLFQLSADSALCPLILLLFSNLILFIVLYPSQYKYTETKKGQKTLHIFHPFIFTDYILS